MVNPVPGFGISTPYGKRGSYWSCNKDSNGNGIHTGVDYAAPSGTKVVAARPGTVQYSNHGSAFGYHQIDIVNYDSGSRDFYAHMRSRAVANGAKVDAGQKIGEVGAEGNVTGAHLHFERHKVTSGGWSCGIVVNPQPSIDYKPSGGGGSGQGDDDVPKYARATNGNDTNMKAGTWYAISWPNPTNGDIFNKGNPGIDVNGPYVAVLQVTLEAKDKLGSYFLQAIEGNFEGKNGAWQITQSLPTTEVPASTGTHTAQHTQIQQVAKGDKLRFRVKSSQPCTLKAAQVTILHW